MEDLKERIRRDIEFELASDDLFFLTEHGTKAIDMMEHCIGLDDKKAYTRHGRKFYRPYRNHYDAGGKDILYWDVMVEQGLAYKKKMYHLTSAGLEALGKRIGIDKIYEEDK